MPPATLFSPYRICPIGAHIDHQGGAVLGRTINIGTTLEYEPLDAKEIYITSDQSAFNVPNKITDADFSGWVQERNAYNLVTFDTRFTPLLESHDAGEQENKGGLVIAKLGTGNWVYCSYSFFRQLPAGVPGAFRLFANLLSLPSEKK